MGVALQAAYAPYDLFTRCQSTSHNCAANGLSVGIRTLLSTTEVIERVPTIASELATAHGHETHNIHCLCSTNTVGTSHNSGNDAGTAQR
jgi:hypothetical protein